MTIINKEFKWDRKEKKLLKITIWNNQLACSLFLYLGIVLMPQKCLYSFCDKGKPDLQSLFQSR